MLDKLAHRRTSRGASASWALYIADTGHQRVLRIDKAGSTVEVAARTGTLSYVARDHRYVPLRTPTGIALDYDEGVLIADGDFIRAARWAQMRTQ